MTEHNTPIVIHVEHDVTDTRSVVEYVMLVCAHGDWSSEITEDQPKVYTDYDMHLKMNPDHVRYYRYYMQRNAGRDESALFKRR